MQVTYLLGSQNREEAAANGQFEFPRVKESHRDNSRLQLINCPVNFSVNIEKSRSGLTRDTHNDRHVVCIIIGSDDV